MESNDEENRKLLSQKIPFYNNLSILKMAAETENLEFISMDPVQKYITKKWNGDFANNSSFLFQINIFVSIICQLICFYFSYNEFTF